MTAPEFANVIRPEAFPEVFRGTVQEISALVLNQTVSIQAEQQRLLSIPDSELIDIQRRSRFCLVDVERCVSREFAKIIALDGKRAE